jgi:tetratricopeptide (TPR) repeat protein
VPRARHAEVVKINQELISVLQKRGEPLHSPRIFLARAQLGNALEVQRRFDQADAIYKSDYDLHLRTHGPDHMTTLGSALNLVGNMVNMGKFAEAEELGLSTLARLRKVHGLDYPCSFQCGNDVASALSLQGKFTEALALMEETLPVMKRVLGPEHDQTLCSVAHYAYITADSGRCSEARALLEDVLEKQIRTLGPDHNHVSLTKKSIAKIGDKERGLDVCITRDSLMMHR